MKINSRRIVPLVLFFCMVTWGKAQEQPQITPEPAVTKTDSSTPVAAQAADGQVESKHSPYLGGYALFTTIYRPGQFSQPGTVFTPVFLASFGDKWLVETKFVLDGEYKRDANSGQWSRTLSKNFEFIQLDYLASRYLTLIAGRYLIPFGIFNERQHAPWIKKLQIQPFIDTGAPSGNGAMLKGAFEIGSSMQLNYAGYFSALSTVETIQTRRETGYRIGIVFPNDRLEFGTSFQRLLPAGNSNGFGLDATWLPQTFPLEFRAEFESSREGKGYWAEGGYRFLRKHEGVARMEQFFVPAGFDKAVNPGPGGNLPVVNTRRPMVGWNYYFRDGLKLGLSYGRELTAQKSHNVETVALVYRFY